MTAATRPHGTSRDHASESAGRTVNDDVVGPSPSAPSTIGPIRCLARDEHDSPGAVREYRGRGAVVAVSDPRHEVGADHERRSAPGPPRSGRSRPRARTESPCTLRRCRTRRRARPRGRAPPAAPRWAAPRRRSSSRPAPGRAGRALTPARTSASRAACAACVVSRSCGSATRRSWIPVRRTIQSSSTPSRAAIVLLGTTVAGRLTPTEAIKHPRVRLAGSCPIRVVSGASAVTADTLNPLGHRRHRGALITRQSGGWGRSPSLRGRWRSDIGNFGVLVPPLGRERRSSQRRAPAPLSEPLPSAVAQPTAPHGRPRLTPCSHDGPAGGRGPATAGRCQPCGGYASTRVAAASSIICVVSQIGLTSTAPRPICGIRPAYSSALSRFGTSIV